MSAMRESYPPRAPPEPRRRLDVDVAAGGWWRMPTPRKRRYPALLLTLLVLCAVPAAAGAAADIEAVWSFGGGQVAVRAGGPGGFTGTVIRTTTLASCPHAVGEQMWANVSAQPDGSYWGGHQWFTDGSCAPIAQRGNTAFRVLMRADGARFLRACFNPPESPDVQPKIAPDGSSSEVLGNCLDSDLISPLPEGTTKVDTIATLPKQGKKRCLSRRSFTIRLKEPPGDALSTASVFLNGKRVQIRRGDRITAPIVLKGLPKGRYTVKIVAKTVLGKTISGSRKYRTCAKRRHSGGPKV
jgi:hypothetical protein